MCALCMCVFTESRLTALERFIDNPAVVMGCLFGFGGKPEGGACLQGRNPPGQAQSVLTLVRNAWTVRRRRKISNPVHTILLSSHIGSKIPQWGLWGWGRDTCRL